MNSAGVGFLTRYGELGASSRVRALQFLPSLKAQGLACHWYPLLGDAYVRSLYAGQRSWREVAAAYWNRLITSATWRQHSLLWVEKELFPLLPFALERQLLQGRRLILDFDDAVFHNYDLSPRPLIRRWLGDKIDRLMARADLVTAGNSYLAERARQAGARRVERLPSCIHLERYPAPSAAPEAEALRVVWIGSPATAHYLDLLRAPLLTLASRRLVALRVIGAPLPIWAQGAALTGQSLPWSPEREAADIAAADVGVMPLHDSPWEQGKCSFKLVQYMACGLPVLASPVGMNRDVVESGVNGYLVDGEQSWIESLDALARDPGLRRRMGAAGRELVETSYCVQAQSPRLGSWMRELLPSSDLA